jgi:hypothetical protein
MCVGTSPGTVGPAPAGALARRATSSATRLPPQAPDMLHVRPEKYQKETLYRVEPRTKKLVTLRKPPQSELLR